MIILADKPGQLGNRLFLFSHLIAHAIENRLTVANPSFDEYSQYFPATSNDLFVRYPLRPSRVAGTAQRRRKLYETVRLFAVRTLNFPATAKDVFVRPPWQPPQRAGTAQQRHKLHNVRLLAVRILKYLVLRPFFEALTIDLSEVYRLNDERLREGVRRKPWVFLRGYRYRDYAAFAKHADELRAVFEPNPDIRAHVNELIQNARKGCDVLVGVHIRQGDYKDFLGGIYFYEGCQYATLMRQVLRCFPDKRVHFLICSNARQEETAFEGLRTAFGTNHLVEDMYSLAQCDYLLGPPSTYSLWASFYGRVPLYQIWDADAPVTRDGFRLFSGMCDFDMPSEVM